MGLKQRIADDYDIAVQDVGLAISAYALGVVVGAPLISAIGARIPRRRLLIGLMVVFAASNLLTLLTRLMDVAGDAQTMAATLNHAVFNIANGLGAWLGGVAVTLGLGWSATGLVGMAMALAGLSIFLIALARERVA